MLRLPYLVFSLLVMAGCSSPDLLIGDSEQVTISTSRTLSETYAVVIGRFELSVRHPEGWYILHQYGDAIAMTNSERLLDDRVHAFVQGELAVLVLYLPKIIVDDVTNPDLPSTEIATQLLNQMVLDGVDDDEAVEITPMMVNERSAVKVRTRIRSSIYDAESTDLMDSVAFAIEQSDGYAIVVCSALAGDLMQYDSLLDDIAESVRVSPLGGG